MAYESKAGFLISLEKRMAEKMTANEMNKALRIVADVIEGYELTEHAAEDIAAEDDLLESFLAAMRVSGRSQKTIDRYDYIIRRMMETVKVSTRRITVYHLRSYIASEKARGISDRTLEGYREIFSSYFNWLQRESLIERNPTANLGAIKYAKKKKQIYSDVDLERLRVKCESARDKAIIAFLSATGCRISEAMDLDRDAVDLQGLECVVHGKGNKERVVFLDAVTGMIMREYLEERTDDAKALFIGRRGERMTPGGVRAMLKRLEVMAGVDHVHPHKFRRTLATTLTRHGMPIQEVASILGHEKLDTTMEYVVEDKENTKNSYKRYR